MKDVWQRNFRGRGRAQGPWPGNGPFSHLPPWQRPGWVYGRGYCWTGVYPNVAATTPRNPEMESQILMNQKGLLEEQLKSIQERLEQIEKRLTELDTD